MGRKATIGRQGLAAPNRARWWAGTGDRLAPLVLMMCLVSVVVFVYVFIVLFLYLNNGLLITRPASPRPEALDQPLLHPAAEQVQLDQDAYALGVTYELFVTQAEVEAFYRRELQKQGWTERETYEEPKYLRFAWEARKGSPAYRALLYITPGEQGKNKVRFIVLTNAQI